MKKPIRQAQGKPIRPAKPDQHKHFYSHLVEIDSLTAMLSDVPMSDTERQELLSLIESNMHHTVLDLVLSELSEEDKQTFLAHLAEDKQDAIWQLLKKRISAIEEKIKRAAEDLTNTIHEDIKRTKQD